MVVDLISIEVGYCYYLKEIAMMVVHLTVEAFIALDFDGRGSD